MSTVVRSGAGMWSQGSGDHGLADHVRCSFMQSMVNLQDKKRRT